jgi:hypothetical protein
MPITQANMPIRMATCTTEDPQRVCEGPALVWEKARFVAMGASTNALQFGIIFLSDRCDPRHRTGSRSSPNRLPEVALGFPLAAAVGAAAQS